MLETTKTVLVREFVSLARKAGTEDAQIECVKFVRDNLLPSNADRPTRQAALLNVFSLVAVEFDGVRDPAVKTYEPVIARIPAAEKNLLGAIRTLALNEGVIKAPARNI